MDRTLYAATVGDGIYASTNGGNTWQFINTGLVGLNIREFKLAGSPNTDYVLFAAPTGRAIQACSVPSSWTRVLNRSIQLAVIATSPEFTTDQTVLATIIPANYSISTDGGFTWINRGNPAATIVHDMAISPGRAREIFLATSRRGIFYSGNSSTSFTIMWRIRQQRQ